MNVISPDKIGRTFEREFWPVAGKFDFFVLESNAWRDLSLLNAALPGVYVWFDGNRNRVIKVGLSLINARARALQHFRDNTGGTMKALENMPNTRMVLFTLEEKDKHWSAALEIYLESALKPEIQSKR